MKIQWLCTWQLIPGRIEYKKAFPTRAEACRAMAKVLTGAVDLSPYIRHLRKQQSKKWPDCVSAADFLEKYLTDFTMPETYKDVPPYDGVPDFCELSINPEGERFLWEYSCGETPSLLHVVEYMDNRDIDPEIIDFCLATPKDRSAGRVTAVYIRIEHRILYGTSAYPLMVLKTLRANPLTQNQICDEINEQYEIRANRKAVGRHLELLRKLGYPVQHGPEGYYLEGRRAEPRTNVEYAPSAYPFLIYDVLDGQPKSKSAIRQAVIDTYNTRISRNAIGRLLELLQLFYSDIQSSEDGYYLG